MHALFSIDPVWITLGPVVAINLVLIFSYLFYQLWGRKRLARDYSGAKNEASRFLSSGTREWWFWTTDPIVRLFVKLKMGPNTITAMGFAISCVAAWLFAEGWFGYAGWVMIFGATFDMFDGRVARITNSSSRSGAFFDAVMDRFGEGVCLLGLCWYFRDSFMLPVTIAALIGSAAVSYTKARGEGMGIDCKVGIMQRPERIVYTGVAAVFSPLLGVALKRWWAEPPPVLMMVAISFIALMTLFTSVQRMIYIMNALDTEDRRKKESIPQIITRLATQAGREEFWERARFGYDRSRAAFSHVVLFLASGISPQQVRELARKGEMPAISRNIIERGGLTDAVGTFPSTMGPSATPFVTGSFPGTCDIPGSRWFDRTVDATKVLAMNRFRDYSGWGAYAMDHDLSKSVRTIFEYSKQAVNIFGALNRGCGLMRDPAFFRTHKRFSEAASAEEIREADEAGLHWFSRAMRRETDFVLYRFAHAPAMSGDAADPAARLREIDGYVGRAVELLRSRGLHDRTALIFASDHGAGDARASFDLDSFLERRFKGFRTGSSARDWQDAEAIAMASGTSMAHIYVKGGPSWSDITFFEDVERRGLVGALLEQEGVDLIAGRSVEGGIVVQSRRGRAHVLEDADGRITYLSKGADPYGLARVPQVMSDAEELSLTQGSEHPDGILQMLQLFRSRRTGDIVVSAREDFSLAQGRMPFATHGSLARGHMMVPFASSFPAPGIGRTADAFALILSLMGIEPAHRLDGAAAQAADGAQSSAATL